MEKRNGIMLAQPLSERLLDRNFNYSGYMLVQPKLDGIRCRVSYDKADLGHNETSAYPILLSSTGHEITSVPHINKAILEMNEFLGTNLLLDGELYAHFLPFEEICSLVNRKEPDESIVRCPLLKEYEDWADKPYSRRAYANKQEYERAEWQYEDELHELRQAFTMPAFTQISFYTFDLILPEIRQKARLAMLGKVFEEYRQMDDWQKFPDWEDYPRPLMEVESREVRTREAIWQAAEDFRASEYEGIILRNPLAKYEFRRPWTMLKFKEKKEDWYEVVDLIPGEYKEYAGRTIVASVECKDRFGNLFSIIPGVGWDFYQREKLWQEREKVVGKYARVHYQQLTEKGVPRFGRFLSFCRESGESYCLVRDPD